MSRTGSAPINLPTNVTLTLEPKLITVKGPKGELTQANHPLVKIDQTEGVIKFEKVGGTKLANSLQGTYNRLVQNMIIGVTEGFQKTLELVGTGYRVQKQGKGIVLSLGLSHQIEYTAPEGTTLEVEGNNKIMVNGIDKQVVGQTAATIRSFRPPEPYKGKGIRYSDEVVRRKAGKAAKTGA